MSGHCSDLRRDGFKVLSASLYTEIDMDLFNKLGCNYLKRANFIEDTLPLYQS